uniref:H/ACA ribonucleoprotein complex subunit 2 n=1 Tax=Cacopsylla melanoneura TaxID=428564 RepID=A0A8D9BRA5_9HEMI
MAPSKEEDLDTTQAEAPGSLSYEEKLRFASPIAHPMATKKLTKKILKLIKKSNKIKDVVLSGKKRVEKGLRKGEKGLCIFAGDVTPIEIMCHLPAVCEDNDISYCYVPSKKDIGEALGRKKPCICVIVKANATLSELYDEVKTEMGALPITW